MTDFGTAHAVNWDGSNSDEYCFHESCPYLQIDVFHYTWIGWIKQKKKMSGCTRALRKLRWWGLQVRRGVKRHMSTCHQLCPGFHILHWMSKDRDRSTYILIFLQEVLPVKLAAKKWVWRVSSTIFLLLGGAEFPSLLVHISTICLYINSFSFIMWWTLTIL